MKTLEFEAPLTTDELALRMTPFRDETSLVVYRTTDFDAHRFVEAVNAPGSSLEVMPTADGLVGKDFADNALQPGKDDYSRQTGFFDVHKDGLAYPRVPHMFLLHCSDPGKLSIPTFFADTRDIINAMKTDDVEQLKLLEMILQKRDGTKHTHNLVQPHSQTGENVLYLASPNVHIKPQNEHVSAVSARDTARVMGIVFDLTDQLSRQHYWKANEASFFDNEALVHGRGIPKNSAEKKAHDPTRRLTRIWMNPKQK